MTTTRRDFVRLGAAAMVTAENIAVHSEPVDSPTGANSVDLRFASPFYRVELAPDQPTFVAFSVDSLGKGHLDANAMLLPPAAALRYHVSRHADRIEYRRGERDEQPAWTFTFAAKEIVIRASAPADNVAAPVVLSFDPTNAHPTLLGIVTDEGNIRLPALLHFPAHGTFRITGTTRDPILAYDASRDHGENFVRVTFPPTTWTWFRDIEYRLEVTSVYPEIDGGEEDPRYDGFRRDFLSIFQLNPRRRALANNSASDATPITLFEYSMMAEHLPPLAQGLTAFDLLRQTLERYIGGMTGYGMIGYLLPPRVHYDFLDVYPALVMAATDYVRCTGDNEWNLRHYSTIRYWAGKILQFDSDGDGLMEYPLSGNSGSWPVELSVRPSNWWDTIGFGHKDAYSNALAYAALLGAVHLATAAGNNNDAQAWRLQAERINSHYYDTFFNPASGVLAGWRSGDGKLHDYYFLFVNGMAVVYGLVTIAQGKSIWDRLLAKMDEVGYRRFDLGLPGNLVPIRREDYVDLNPRYGGPSKKDGSDGFQIFENGGASACYAYYTIQALRMVGRSREADAMLFAILESFAKGRFVGRGPNGETYDWTDWNGNPHGYEGLLVDNYLILLAATNRH